MKKFFRYISSIWLSSRNKGKFVWVDGKYNSVTLSHSLYKHLLTHTKKGDNHVFVFRTNEPDGLRYCFAAYKNVEPVLKEETITSELKLSPKHYFIGFVTDQVPNILQEYNLAHDGISKVFVIPRTADVLDDEGRVIHSYIYYELKPYKRPYIPRF